MQLTKDGLVYPLERGGHKARKNTKRVPLSLTKMGRTRIGRTTEAESLVCPFGFEIFLACMQPMKYSIQEE